MKLTYTLLPILTFLFTTSCKKEEPVKIEEQTPVRAEVIIPGITNSEINFSDHQFLYGDYRGCSFYGIGSGYSWYIDFRIGEGYQSEGKVFYPIEKKWKVESSVDEYEEGYAIENLSKWNKQTDWAPTGALYRYDPNEQLALKYADENDTDPEILMNFKMVSGDTWTLQTEGQTRFEVVEKFEFTIDGITYPALLTDLKTGYGDHKLRYAPYNSRYIFTPLNPNPLMIGMDYMNMLRPNWNVFQVKDENQPGKWPAKGFEAISKDNYESFYFLIGWKSDSSIMVNNQSLRGKIQSFK